MHWLELIAIVYCSLLLIEFVALKWYFWKMSKPRTESLEINPSQAVAG